DSPHTGIGGEFSLAYLIFNTIFNLVTQDAQVACFENAAAHLGSGGRFVIETGVPDPQKLPRGPPRTPLWRRPGRGPSGGVPLRLAGRARPHGPPGRPAAAGPLGRLAAAAVHQPQPRPRLGVREALNAPGAKEADMAGSAELLVDAFGRVRGVVHRVVDGLTPEQLAFRVDPGANSIAWLVWHLPPLQDAPA